MKYILSMMMFLFITCTSKPTENKVSIVDYRNSKVPEVKPESHKDKDVDIFRTLFFGNTYQTVIYRIDNGQLKGYQVNYGSYNDFDKASYSWVNDSTVIVKLFSSSGDSTARFSVSGYGSTTSLEDLK
jgi:hypothetical protein